MTRKNFYYGALVLGAAVTLTLAVTLTVSLSRSHRQPTPAASAPILAQATTSAASESKGAQMEGIKVHGHWIIDVRNPDGKLVKHLEFENALMPGGGNALARFLGRAQTVGAWEIELSNFPASGSPFGTGSGLSGSGWIVESTSSRSESISPYGTVSKTLSITSPAFSINTAGSLVLGGNVAAVLTGSFSSVATWNRFCSQTTSPADCVGNTNIALFTATPIAPVNLSAGQIVQVTVTISFSSTP